MLEKITTALISVSDKTGLLELVEVLNKNKVAIISTGGTAKFIEDAGFPVIYVSDYTKMAEFLAGRVKTLHPKIQGGILARLDNDQDMQDLEKNGINPINLVVCNLYPFAETIAKTDDYATCIENIDIGGPTMIRATAKNHKFSTVLTDPDDYQELINEMDENDGSTTFEFRQFLAYEAFKHVSAYDALITKWFSEQLGANHEQGPEKIIVDSISLKLFAHQDMNYGENPHQKAGFYVEDRKDLTGIALAKQLNGKKLSYNNIADANSAHGLVSKLEDHSCVIIKHANPCGVATADNSFQALEKAWAGDSVSAFGSIIAFNNTLDLECAKFLKSKFVEVIIAPKFSDEVLEILTTKKNLRLLEWATDDSSHNKNRIDIKSVNGGYLIQEKESHILDDDNLEQATKASPNQKQLADLKFAWKVCSVVKSNAIVLVKNQQVIGVGAGQMSRLDSAKIAINKAKESGFDTTDSVCASDAFFPFADGLEVLAKEGVTSFIQPGGSIRDPEVIEKANEYNCNMLLTRIRAFLH